MFPLFSLSPLISTYILILFLLKGNYLSSSIFQNLNFHCRSNDYSQPPFPSLLFFLIPSNIISSHLISSYLISSHLFTLIISLCLPCFLTLPFAASSHFNHILHTIVSIFFFTSALCFFFTDSPLLNFSLSIDSSSLSLLLLLLDLLLLPYSSFFSFFLIFFSFSLFFFLLIFFSSLLHISTVPSE